jgi:hypothetical protein
MAQLKIQIKSNHEDGDSFENNISLELNDELLGDFVSSTEIDWAKLNSSILSYPNYSSLVKDEIVKNKIEIPDPNYWTTTGTVISFNTISMPEDFEMYEIEDKLMTGDLI